MPLESGFGFPLNSRWFDRPLFVVRPRWLALRVRKGIRPPLLLDSLRQLAPHRLPLKPEDIVIKGWIMVQIHCGLKEQAISYCLRDLDLIYGQYDRRLQLQENGIVIDLMVWVLCLGQLRHSSYPYARFQIISNPNQPQNKLNHLLS